MLSGYTRIKKISRNHHLLHKSIFNKKKYHKNVSKVVSTHPMQKKTFKIA